jgi:hypothetical protein
VLAGAHPASLYSELWHDPDLTALVSEYWATGRPLAAFSSAVVALAAATVGAVGSGGGGGVGAGKAAAGGGGGGSGHVLGLPLVYNLVTTALPSDVEFALAWTLGLLHGSWAALAALWGCGRSAAAGGVDAAAVAPIPASLYGKGRSAAAAAVSPSAGSGEAEAAAATAAAALAAAGGGHSVQAQVTSAQRSPLQFVAGPRLWSWRSVLASVVRSELPFLPRVVPYAEPRYRVDGGGGVSALARATAAAAAAPPAGVEGEQREPLVVEDGHYLSARGGSDAFRLAWRFMARLEEVQRVF